MNLVWKSIFLCIFAIAPSSLAQNDGPPLPAEINPPGWPLIGYGLAFLLVGIAVYVSMYTSKRANIE